MPFSAVILAALVVASGNGPGPSKSGTVRLTTAIPVANDDDTSVDTILLDLVSSKRRLASNLVAYQDQQHRLYIPLAQTSLALGFRLQVAVDKKTARGFLFSPSDTLDINFAKGEIRWKDKLAGIPSEAWLARGNDIFVDAQVFASWTRTSCTWHADSLELEFESKAVLPAFIQSQLAQVYQSTNQDESLPDPTRISTPYKWWSVPSMDIRLDSQFDSLNNTGSPNSTLDIEGSGDLLTMGSKYHLLSNSNGKAPALLMSLERFDSNSRLFGPLRASRVEVGDLYLPPIPLLVRGRAGLGISIGNGSPMAANPVSSVRGHAPNGSSVELYRSDRLLSSVNATAAGTYSFDDLSLHPGPNKFHIVIVGSDGSISESDQILYGGSSVPDGATQYRLTADEAGSSLIPGSAQLMDQGLRGTEFTAEADRSIGAGTWVSATAATLLSQKSSYLGLGLNTWRGDNLLHFNLLGSESGGVGASVGLSRRFGNNSLSIDRTFFSSGLRTGIAPEFGPGVSALTSIRWDGFAKAFGRQFTYSLWTDSAEGAQAATRSRFQVSTAYHGMSISNTLELNTGGAVGESVGLLRFEKPLGDTSSSFEVFYNTDGSQFLRETAFSLNRSISRDYRVGLRTDYQATRTAPLAETATLYRLMGPLALGLSFEVRQNGGLNVGLQLSTSLSGSGGSALGPPGASNNARIKARVYLDKNQSGTYDKGDTLLPAVSIVVNKRAVGTTGTDGTCQLQGLGVQQDVAVRIDESSLEDPFWLSVSPGFLLNPRPGQTETLDFPVVCGSEVDGSIGSIADTDENLVAQLLEADGKVVSTSEVDLDGEYVFSRVREGHYTLRVVGTDGAKVGEQPLEVVGGGKIQEVVLATTKP